MGATVFLSLLFISALIIGQFILPKSYQQQLQEKLLKSPLDPQIHFKLITFYLDSKQPDRARQALKKVQNIVTLNPDESTKREQQKKIDQLWQEWEHKDPQEIKKRIAHLEDLTSKYPRYPDPYLQLAIHYLQLRKDKKAHQALEMATALAPNYQPSEKIKSLFSSLEKD